MTINEQIAALTAQQQALRENQAMDYHEKRERSASITDRIAALYAERRQEAADRRTTLADRARR